MATKQGSSLQRHSRHHHRLPFNRSTLFHSAEVIPTVALRLLYYSCFLCLILNTKCDFAMVQASYSETDDLINELDRPSKYQTLVLPFVPRCWLPLFISDQLKIGMFCVCAAPHSMNYTIKICANATNANPFVIISTLHRAHDRHSFSVCFWRIQKTRTEEELKWKESALFPNPLLSSWSIETATKKSAPPRLQ